MASETPKTNAEPAPPPREPARAKTTRALVHEAALALLLEGHNPSWRAVRERIGQGSSTTITDELKAFWAMIAERLRLPALPEEVAQASLTFWAVAAKAGEAAFEIRRQAIEAELKAGAARANEAERRTKATAARLAEAQDRIAALEDTLAAQREEMARVTRRLDAEGAKRQNAEALLADTRQRLDAQAQAHAAADRAREARHAKALATLKHEHAARLALEEKRNDANEKRLVEQLEAARSEHKAAENQLAEAKAHLGDAKLNVTELTTRLKAAETERQRVERRATTLQGELTSMTGACRQLEERVAALMKDAERIERERDTLNAALARANETAHEHTEACARLRERLAATEAEAALLREESSRRHAT